MASFARPPRLAVAVLLLLMVGLLGVSRAQAQYVYVGNSGDETISQFGSRIGGLLSPLTSASIATEGRPASLASSPNGHNLYAIAQTEAGGSIAQFAIAKDGSLQTLTPPSVPVAYPTSIAVSPNGRFAYVTDFEGDGSVAQFSIGPDGALTPLSPASVPVEGATAVAISPDSRFAYVVDGEATGYVWQFEVSSDGTLQPLSPASIQVGFKPYGLAISPDGDNVYVIENDKRLIQLAVAADGTLSLLSPESAASADYVVSIAVSPDGGKLIATEVPGEEAAGVLQSFERHSSGTLTSTATIAAPTGSMPWALAISPDGQNVYVTDLESSGTGGLLQFGFGSAGELEAKPEMAVDTGARPDAIAISSEPPPAQPTQTSKQSSSTSPETKTTATAAALAPSHLKVEEVSQSRRVWREPVHHAHHKKVAIGTTFSFTLSGAGTVTLSFTQKLHGRRVGHRCSTATHSNRHRHACTHKAARGSLVVAGNATRNTVKFNGKLKSSALPAGNYTVQITATDASGERSAPVSLAFRILR